MTVSKKKYYLPYFNKAWEFFLNWKRKILEGWLPKNLRNKPHQIAKESHMKYLVVGLGNIGDKYTNTRHNVGFNVLDTLAEASDVVFKDARYGAVTQYKFKGRIFVLLKPSTYVNLSGKAVNYWLKKEKIPIENMVVIVDDLSLPFGTLRLRAKGGDAGHNGLKNINEILGHQNYARLRFGIGDDFHTGQQVSYVLDKWNNEEIEKLTSILQTCREIINSFGTIGVQRTMNIFNIRKNNSKTE